MMPLMQSDRKPKESIEVEITSVESGLLNPIPTEPSVGTAFEGDDVTEVFNLVLTSEMHISESIHDIIETCTELRDFTTLHFLQWYVTEQHEEEKLARTILDKIEIIGLEGQGLYLFDKEMTNLQVDTEMKAQESQGGGAA